MLLNQELIILLPTVIVTTATLSLSLFSMGTVRADLALFGQAVLVIFARLYTQSMVALSLSLSSPWVQCRQICLSLSLLHGYSMGRYGSLSLSLFSMGTVQADTALFGQPVLVIFARLYTQSMVALSLSLSSPWVQCAQIWLSLSLFSMGTVRADMALSLSSPWVQYGQIRLSLSLFSMGTVRADTALSLSLSLLHGYSTGRYGSLWAASAGDICPSLYSEYGCSVSLSLFSMGTVCADMALSLSLSLSLLHGYSMGRYGSLSLSLSSPWVQYGQIRLSLGSQCW